MIERLPPAFSLPVLALSFLAGVLCMQMQPEMPSLYWIGVLPVAIFATYYCSRYVWLVLFFAGFFWAYWFGWSYLRAVPDESLVRQNIIISGVIADLPVVQKKSTKFRFNIESFKLDGYSGHVPEHIRLSWYYANIKLKPGERWQFLVRLKPPNGMLNPGGFDYEAWLYQQGIHATGYIKKSKLNKKLGDATGLSFINQIRDKIRQHINSNAEPEQAGLLNALAIGYRADMTADSWQMFIKTGTNHLIAISGLHIGLVAGFVWFILNYLNRIKYLGQFFNRRLILLVSFIAALIYAALAGFTIPTQRALIMLAVVYLGLFLYRQLTVVQSLSLALLLVLIISPTSVLSVGFWLSFLAVAAISYSIAGRLPGRKKVLVWIWPQVVVIFALMPLGFYFFQQSSAIALFANIIAIPLISLLILPVLLAGILFLSVHSGFSVILINFAAEILSYLVGFLSHISEYEYSTIVHSQPDLFSLFLATIGVILLFAPYAFPARWLSFFLFLPVVTGQAEKISEGDYVLHVLDVGQGLSVYLKTTNHSLLFDTGARFSQRFDVGERVVLPFLRHQGISKLDKLIISNGDNDHIGGAEAIIKHFEVEQVLGRDIENLNHAEKLHCQQGQKWSWDGVSFEILHPQHQNYRKRNNYSCVLKVWNRSGSVLIAADIEKKAELELVEKYTGLLNSEVLIVPHHGSKTSSSVSFLNNVKPETIIYSAGYLNRYDFPRPEIIERYSRYNTEQLNTAETGHIWLKFDHDGLKIGPISYRQENHRYWQRAGIYGKY